MLNLRVPLILASRSPRRSQLLRRLGLAFEVRPSQVNEDVSAGTLPGDLVQELALRKAADVARHAPAALTLGADTIVVLDGKVLGKPNDEEEARRMLGWLSGRTHAVYSGIALLHPETERASRDYQRTEVTFGELSEREIAAYVATGSPLDKAGAYGIQDDLGALLIDRIAGDYYNVVGLPLRCLYRLLRQDFPDLVESA